MSGFDFDALRDPVAPEPGARERNGVDARARQLRARRLRNRFALTTGAVALIAAIVLGVVGIRQQQGPEIAVPGSTTTTVTSPTTAGPSVGARFIPPTTTQNGLVVLPVTLPDGETFTMKYPPAMQIAQLGFEGGAGVVGFSGLSSRAVTISYTTLQHVYGDRKPIAVYRGAEGEQVPLLRAPELPGARGGAPAQLVFQFGHWLVQVDDGQEAMTAPQLSTWARNLSGSFDRSGYLVLHASAPLRVANWFDGGFGPLSEHGPNQIELASNLYCGQPESDTSTRRRTVSGGEPAVTWCDGNLHVSATGTSSFVDLAATVLQVSPLTSAPAGPTAPTTTTARTTTTTSPVVTSAGALSATWVSPTHGWVLERTGQIDTTTDGGTTWSPVGQLGNHDPDTKIRFADAERGFAYNSRSFFGTTDGGAQWTALHAPFSDVLDLEITRGVAYAVAFPPNGAAPREFGLWSAPIGTQIWAEHSLALGIAGGGDPSEQLVFAGGHGWVLDVMRTVIAGGRLSPGSDWAKWNPPCLGVEGPAYLAASTSSDVVADCDEGVWGGNYPKVTATVYFSHDGGLTFQRHLAPGFGAVASPSPTTAVIATTSGLKRTTDGGVTWLSVLGGSQGFGASDIGFTTGTQGFVIFENGPMFMTYDAGATWQRARLP